MRNIALLSMLLALTVPSVAGALKPPDVVQTDPSGQIMWVAPLGTPLIVAAVAPASALAQSPVPQYAPTVPLPESDLSAFAASILAAFQARNWALLTALALLALVFAARKFGGKLWPFLATDRGGALLSLVGGLALSIAAAASAPGSTGFGAVLLSGLLMAITASGTYALLRKLLFPSGAQLAEESGAKGAATQAAAGDAGAVAAGIRALGEK